MLRKFIDIDSEESIFGKNPSNRTLKERFDKGAIIIDKDAGPTSHMVSDMVKEILPVKKCGHSGTLDPQVTGVLLVGLGRATRLMEYMLTSNKEYICLCFFHKPVSDDDLKKVFTAFEGEIDQLPPVVSAVKREKRKRTIYELEILGSEQNNQYVLFRVSCQHGTYIRKLCTDMGSYLGVNAQMVELRRTKAGPLHETNGAISLDKLRNLYELYLEEKDEKNKDIFEKELLTYIRPQEDLVEDFKQVIVKDSTLESLTHGHDLAIPGIVKLEEKIELGEEVSIMTQKGELIAMGRAVMSSDEVRSKSKGYAVTIEKVFMDAITFE